MTMRVVGSKATRPPEGVFDCLEGETEVGGALRWEAFAQSSAWLEERCEGVRRSLCRRTWEAVASWLEASPSEDPEAPARVAVVRPGFCEGRRRWAIECDATSTWVAAGAEDLATLEVPKGTVVVVPDAEGCSDRRLCEFLPTAEAGVALVAASHWSVPSTLPTGVSARVFAREFAMPPFEAFVDALFSDLATTFPIVLGPKVVEACARSDDACAVVSRIKYALFVHFSTRPNAFIACADDVDLAAREAALDASRVQTALASRQLARLVVAATEAALRLSKACDTSTAWTTAFACLASAATAKAALRRALRLLDSPSRLLDAWRRLFVGLVRDDVLGPVFTDPRTPVAEALSVGLRLVASRLAQLEALARECEIDARFDDAVIDLYDALLHEAQRVTKARALYFDDARALDKPFAGGMWSAVTAALATSAKELRGLAFQVLADHQNLDLPAWFQHLQRKKSGYSEHDDPDQPPDDRSCQFVRFLVSALPAHFPPQARVVRDLAYTGLVRDHTKRGKFIICGH